ncbi:hypothetical protein [Plantactinospora sp. KBS50]|uniref:hypothetical protein n=1 Tax=Plantactinospora sp. KBS50 TaxID=2024580 RepID=UPI0012FD047C|nr:hypothetical protein [Plantactinospora sp. KBS50]
MDALDRLAGPAADLLGRVDDLLGRAGAPPEHPIWPLVRRTGTLPGPAAAAVAALRPGPPADAADALRRPARAYGTAAASLTGPVDWAGPGAEAFAARRAALAGRISGEADSLTGRLDRTADFAAALADWADRARDRLSRTLAEVLGSAEAVAVVLGSAGTGVMVPGSGGSGVMVPGSGGTGGVPTAAVTEPDGAAARAAAEIGVRVLATVAQVLSDGDDLLDRYGPEPGGPPDAGPDAPAYRWDGTTRVRH